MSRSKYIWQLVVIFLSSVFLSQILSILKRTLITITGLKDVVNDSVCDVIMHWIALDFELLMRQNKQVNFVAADLKLIKAFFTVY